MHIRQISIFLQNEPGQLSRICRDLADAGINIATLSLADTTDFGILRLIVDKPHETEKVLRDSGFTVSVTSVIAVGIDDVPGGFAKPMRVLANAHIDVEYMYAFISRSEKDAYVILRTDRHELAESVLAEAGVRMLLPDGAGVNW